MVAKIKCTCAQRLVLLLLDVRTNHFCFTSVLNGEIIILSQSRSRANTVEGKFIEWAVWWWVCENMMKICYKTLHKLYKSHAMLLLFNYLGKYTECEIHELWNPRQCCSRLCLHITNLKHSRGPTSSGRVLWPLPSCPDSASTCRTYWSKLRTTSGTRHWTGRPRTSWTEWVRWSWRLIDGLVKNSGVDNRKFVQNVIQAPNLAWWFQRVYLANLCDVPLKQSKMAAIFFKMDAECVCRKWFCS